MEKNVSFPLYLGFHWRDFPEASTTMPYRYFYFGSDWSQMKGTLPGEETTFWLCLGFHLGEFSEILQFAFSRPALEKMAVWLRLVNN